MWLVGAGPGDPGLLTLLALHALGSADIVVYDALVDERILKLANPKAMLEYAGKRGGRPSLRQPDISKGLIAHAKAGKRCLHADRQPRGARAPSDQGRPEGGREGPSDQPGDDAGPTGRRDDPWNLRRGCKGKRDPAACSLRRGPIDRASRRA